MKRNASKHFSRVFIFALVMSIIPLLMLGTISYYTASQKLFNKELENNRRVLRHSKLALESLIKNIDNSLNQFMNSPTLGTIIHTKHEPSQYMAFADLNTDLRKLQTLGNGITDVCLVNPKENWVVDNSILSPLSTYRYKEKYLRYINTPKLTMWEIDYLGEEDYPTIEGNSMKGLYLNIIKKPLNSLKSNPSYLIFARMPIHQMYKQLSQEHEKKGRFYIINSAGKVVFDKETSNIGKDMSGETYIKDILAGDMPEGFLSIKQGGDTYGIAFVKSEYNEWIFLSMTKYMDIMKESDAIRSTTLLVVFIVITICLVAGYFYSKKLTLPLSELVFSIVPGAQIQGKVDEVKYIGDHVAKLLRDNEEKSGIIDSQKEKIRQMLFKRLYMGDIPKGEIKSTLISAGIEIAWKWMAVVSIQVETLVDTVYEEDDVRQLIWGIMEISKGLMPDESLVGPVAGDGTLIMLLGGNQSSREAFKSYIVSISTVLRNTVYEKMKLKIIIGGSDTFSDVDNISDAWYESINVIKWNIIEEGKGIYFSGEKIPSEQSMDQKSAAVQAKRDFVNALRIGDGLSAQALFEKYIQNIKNIKPEPEEYQLWLAGLVADCLEVFYENNEAPIEGCISLEELLGLKTASEVDEWFRNKIIEPIVHIQKEANRKNRDVIVDCMLQVVHEEYEKDLSLNELADRLNYHPNYLGKLFRQVKDVSFSDYLSEYRLNVAKKWLEETDMKIGDIAQKLRYTNSQNFIRYFSKIEGITPGQYRERKKNI